MSSSPSSQLRADRQRLDAHFLEVVRQTIAELKFNDDELTVLLKDCETARDCISELECGYTTEQDLTKYGNLFRHLEVDIGGLLGYCMGEKSMKRYFTTLEKDVRKLLNELKHREQRVDQIRACIWFRFDPMNKEEQFQVFRFIYEEEPFALMGVRDDSQRGKKVTTRWLRYNSKTKCCKEVKLSDLELKERICRSDEIFKELASADQDATTSKKSNESSKIKAELEATIESPQAQPPAAPRKHAQNTSFQTTIMASDKNSTVTTDNDEAEWDVIDDMVDSEIDTVLVL